MLTADYQRPAKLYRYSERQWLERSLALGEFRLRPPAENLQINHLHNPRPAGTPALPQLLTLSMSSIGDDKLFDVFSPSDCCLIIHNTEEFGERIHRAAQRVLPNWAGIDAAICYGKQSPLGAAFSKNKRDAAQHEWLFAWRPAQPTITLRPIIIRIGNIEGIAELRDRA
ncbi:hypothetical protein [Paraherbaspirillum soli]|uniref:RES domain-containing protein n=1 Tax=Paraherbaspirillum soli TaxID=631222 RepID=A0ABW0M8C1_9BURK